MSSALREATAALERGFQDVDMRDLPGPVLTELRALTDKIAATLTAIRDFHPD